MSQNTFDNLATLALYVCAEPSDPPDQWIFAVDDSWLHHGWQGNGATSKLQPLFKVTERSSSQAVTPSQAREQMVFSESSEEVSSSAIQLLSEPERTPHHDGPVANALLKFIDHHQRQYGICFCTFEYFWTNITRINKAQNAVFFDIRHQLAESDTAADLATSWTNALDAYWKLNPLTEQNGTTTRTSPFIFDHDVLGFHLYFALKLGWIPNAPTNRIGDNHLLILSSNLFETAELDRESSEDNPQAESKSVVQSLENGKTPISNAVRQQILQILKSKDRESAFQSFLRVQKAVWDRIAKGDKFKHKGLDFTIIPIPKGKQGGLLDTGLTIFDNTFQNAASWDAKLDALWHDMALSWQQFDWGHYQQEGSNWQHQRADLHSAAWLPSDDSLKQKALRGMYYVNWKQENASTISVGTLAEFLEHHCETGSVNFTDADQNCKTSPVSLPSCPGILFAFALVHLLRELATKKENGENRPNRTTPKVSWSRKMTTVKMTIQLEQAEDGISKLKSGLFGGADPGGTIQALKNLVCAQLAILDVKNCANKMIGDIGKGGIALRDKLTSESAETQPAGRTLPSFDANSICFYFHVLD